MQPEHQIPFPCVDKLGCEQLLPRLLPGSPIHLHSITSSRTASASILPSPSASYKFPTPLCPGLGCPLAEMPAKLGSALRIRDRCQVPTPCKAGAQDQSSEGQAWSHSKGEWIGSSNGYQRGRRKTLQRPQAPIPNRRGLAWPWEQRNGC